MPALYIGHGAPPLLDDRLWTEPAHSSSPPTSRGRRAILIVSAHWEAAPLSLSATAAGTPLVYDFGGFDERFYRMTYATPDASALARQVAAVMPQTEPVHEHASRGLDHGAWVPLKVMYPDADIPVLQLSLPTYDPTRLLELGRRLRPLRDEGVLVIGSGLPHPRAAVPARLAASTRRRRAGRSSSTRGRPRRWPAVTSTSWPRSRPAHPGMPYAHPTVEHFAPLFVTLGAATETEAAPGQVIDGFWMGLSKRSLQVA